LNTFYLISQYLAGAGAAVAAVFAAVAAFTSRAETRRARDEAVRREKAQDARRLFSLLLMLAARLEAWDLDRDGTPPGRIIMDTAEIVAAGAMIPEDTTFVDRYNDAVRALVLEADRSDAPSMERYWADVSTAFNEATSATQRLLAAYTLKPQKA